MSANERLDPEVDTTPITEPDLTKSLTPKEVALRDKFVTEYLKDFDSLSAAIRTGYSMSYAREFAVKLMQDAYVLQQIRLRNAEDIESPEAKEEMRKRVIAGLLLEANYKGPGSSQAARVAAWSKLANIEGMEAPRRSSTELTGPDGQPLSNGAGLFVVPGIMTIEDWEKQAAAQQAALTAPDPKP